MESCIPPFPRRLLARELLFGARPRVGATRYWCIIIYTQNGVTPATRIFPERELKLATRAGRSDPRATRERPAIFCCPLGLETCQVSGTAWLRTGILRFCWLIVGPFGFWIWLGDRLEDVWGIDDTRDDHWIDVGVGSPKGFGIYVGGVWKMFGGIGVT